MTRGDSIPSRNVNGSESAFTARDRNYDLPAVEKKDDNIDAASKRKEPGISFRPKLDLMYLLPSG